MPDRRNHVDHCRDLYGYGFEEIHAWMDGTVKSRGKGHRVDRHDIGKTPDKAYKIFKDKVPEQYREYIKDAVKDHIELDKRKSGKLVSKKSEGIDLTDFSDSDHPLLEGIGLGIAYGFMLGLVGAVVSGGFFFFVAGVDGGIVGVFLGVVIGFIIFSGIVSAGYEERQKRKKMKEENVLEEVKKIERERDGLGGEHAESSVKKCPECDAILEPDSDFCIECGAKLAVEREGVVNRGEKTEEICHCETCGKRISREEYEKNGGQCDNCVVEDSGIAMIYK